MLFKILLKGSLTLTIFFCATISTSLLAQTPVINE
ncbi:MAG: hypothetical protein ACJA2S_001747, partial [Cyclobacteriaceae bacterium]